MLALKCTLRGLLIGAMAASVVMINVFGQGQADLHGLYLAAAAGGFCTNAGMVGLYAIVAPSFPTALRGSGTGFVIGVGRGGAALSPVLAGTLLQSGRGLATVAMAMAYGSLLGAIALLMLPKKPAEGN
jgi:MFS family permease